MVKTDLPKEIYSYIQELSPATKNIKENIEIARKIGYQAISSFILPKKSWWDDYYSPIEAKLPSLKTKHKGDKEALQHLASEEKEIEMFRKYSDYYGYAFYVLQKI